ncbi:MAG: hypothetical protein IJH63_03095 [Methanobrevibacter sp.]|nr:hypothetical protein [Methanobrevibacter sp.]
MAEKDLKINKEPKILKLEELLVDGVEVEVPITFDYPTANGIVPVSAIIRPLTTVEWEEATTKSIRNDNKGFTLEIIGKGLLNDDGEPLNPELLKGMPIGVVNEIYKQVADISGIREDKEEQYRLTRELMGF